MSKSFKLALVLWLAAGIAVSGYFHISPDQKKEPMQRYYSDDFTNRNISALTCLVGIVLIGGIGWVVGNREN